MGGGAHGDLGFAARDGRLYGIGIVVARMPKWWFAAVGSVVLIVLFGYFSGDFFFDFFPADSGQPISVSANLPNGSSQWITISRAVTPKAVGLRSFEGVAVVYRGIARGFVLRRHGGSLPAQRAEVAFWCFEDS